MKIVCIGDSITYGYGIERSESWVSLLAQNSKHEVINKGIPGNTTAEMLSRFTMDVLPHGPSQVLILGGTNDILINVDIDLNSVLSHIESMVNICKTQGIVPILLTPLPVKTSSFEKTWFKEVDYKAANNQLMELRQLLLTYGRDHQMLVIDIGHEIAKQIDLEKHFLADGIHVSREVHRMIAEIISSNLQRI